VLCNFCFSQTNIDQCDTSIVKLNDFSIDQNGSNVKLFWSTLFEKNNDYFIIERSIDEVSWEQIKIVPGSNCSTIEVFYDILDNSPKEGLNYYRLTCVDKDGQTIILVNGKTSFNADLFHLTVSQKNRLIIKGTSLNLNELMLYNSNGHKTLADCEILSFQSDRIELNITDLAMGIYLVHINGEILRFMKF
jgi:hypothetical protein